MDQMVEKQNGLEINRYGATAMIGSLCAALFLPYPYNLISVIAVCTPCGLSMRKIIINALMRVISKKNEETEA